MVAQIIHHIKLMEESAPLKTYTFKWVGLFVRVKASFDDYILSS